MATAAQWRDAANGLREHAALWDKKAEEAELAEGRAICGVVCEAGPNGEPLGCGFKPGHDGSHAWATLPTFIRKTEEMVRKAKGYDVLPALDPVEGLSADPDDLLTPEEHAALTEHLADLARRRKGQ